MIEYTPEGKRHLLEQAIFEQKHTYWVSSGFSRAANMTDWLFSELLEHLHLHLNVKWTVSLANDSEAILATITYGKSK
jgi:hypothetical protein